ncbi:hypothetical protein GW17_00027607 [Ensete ventricosum]|nr:hypothetical protein GW17_00027607 [Ensete ventricosum]
MGTALRGPLPFLIPGTSFNIYRLSVWSKSVMMHKKPPTIIEVAIDLAREPWSADIKFLKKDPPTLGYSGDIYTCGTKEGLTEMFNGSDAFGRPMGTTLIGSLIEF